MSLLSNLSPGPVWSYFGEICRIPRLSGNEGRIREFLLDFAAATGLEAKQDIAGNILITRPPSPGKERKKCIVLQSHMDMVGEKNADHPHNWLTDPILPVIDGEWVSATGTTLGADDGIGIAAQMAILTDPSLKAGKIECLFTVDEESGMTGATNLDPSLFTGKTLLNLDSEDEGILYIGCAGGMDTVGTMTVERVPVGAGSAALEIAVTGLHGGHSGDEIHKGYGNSVKIMVRILSEIQEKYGLSLCSFDGGNLRNAIPREAFAIIAAAKSDIGKISGMIDSFQQLLSAEFGELEKELKITGREVTTPATAVDPVSQEKFLKVIASCPHGALAWSKEMDDLVETSTNLASARLGADNMITIVSTQRSSVDTAKHAAAAQVKTCLEEAGALVVQSGGYPGWKPDLSSEILQLTARSYLKLFGREPQIRAIHAGLECGLIYEKTEGIDMISFGPTIRGAHTPEEKIEIRTTQMFWDLLVDVIINMPDTEPFEAIPPA